MDENSANSNGTGKVNLPKPPPAKRPKLESARRAAKGPLPPGITRFEYGVIIGGGADSLRVANPALDGEIIALHQEVCAAHNIQPGKLIIADSVVPNAAYLINGSTVVNTGLTKIMSRNEVKGVLAHEASHQKHHWKHLFSSYGVGLMVAVGITVGLFVWGRVAGEARWNKPFNFLGDKVLSPAIGEKWGQPLGQGLRRVFLTGIDFVLKGVPLGWGVSKAYRAMHSQQYETEADDEAVRITRDPEALASAFEKLEKRSLRIRQKEIEGRWEYLHEREAAHPARLPEQPEVDDRIARDAKNEMAKAVAAAAHTGSHPPLAQRVERQRAKAIPELARNKDPRSHVERAEQAALNHSGLSIV